MRLTKGNIARVAFPAGKAEHILYDDDVTGFGLRMHPGGRQTWFVQFRFGAKQRRLKLGTSDKIDADRARDLAKKALAKVELGIDPSLQVEEAKAQAALTLAGVAEAYLSGYAASRLKPRSLLEVQRHLRSHWAPLSKLPVLSITRANVATHLGKIARDNGPFAANRARAALSAMYRWAIGEGIAHANPVAGTHKPAEEVTRDRVLSDEELALVWQLAPGTDFAAIVRLLMLTAQRREECGGMLWSEINGALWRIGADRTKNRLGHDVPLNPPALSIIGNLPRRADRDLVFGARAGPFSGYGKPKAELDARMLAALKERHGTKAVLTPWRLHDLRRTAATRMADLGVLPHVIEAVLNHISGHRAGVAGVYNRASYAAEKRAALELWGRHVQTLVEDSRG